MLMVTNLSLIVHDEPHLISSASVCFLSQINHNVGIFALTNENYDSILLFLETEREMMRGGS